MKYTKDLEVFIATDQDNAKGVYAALKEFGAPLENLNILFISRSDLIRVKEASDRPQDRIDVYKLKEAEQLGAFEEE